MNNIINEPQRNLEFPEKRFETTIERAAQKAHTLCESFKLNKDKVKQLHDNILTFCKEHNYKLIVSLSSGFVIVSGEDVIGLQHVQNKFGGRLTEKSVVI